jgi:hypothetical protein
MHSQDSLFWQLKGISPDPRSQAIAYANLLDRYNNGLIGPVHCDANPVA